MVGFTATRGVDSMSSSDQGDSADRLVKCFDCEEMLTGCRTVPTRS